MPSSAQLPPFPLHQTRDRDAYERLERAHRDFHALPWWRRRARKRLADEVASARAACIAAGPETPAAEESQPSGSSYAASESSEFLRDEFPMPAPPSRRRRIATGGGLVATVVAVIAVLNFAGENPVPASVPVLGRNATSVFNQIRQHGVPITDGEPADAKFREMTRNNACQSSRSFVRSEADQGWGVICVRPPRDVYRRISRAFDGIPMLLGPLYVDDDNGHVVVFGFGWPSNASKMIAKAMNSNGSYLQPE